MHSQPVRVCASTERTASARVASARYAGMTMDTSIAGSLHRTRGSCGDVDRTRSTSPQLLPDPPTPAVRDVLDPEGIGEFGAGVTKGAPLEEAAVMDFHGYGTG